MIFWLILAVLAASVSLSVLIPLYRTRQVERLLAEQEVSVYRDQLKEVDRDVERRLIGDQEAEAARTEIARRLIKADSARSATPDSGEKDWPRRIAAVGVVVVLPVLTIGLYLFVGSPGLLDAPLEARRTAPAAEQDTAALIARVEEHLSNNPDDAEGWALLAPIYVRLGQYDDAILAYEAIIRVEGSTADTEAALGETIVRANEGRVTAQARAAFERSVALDPTIVGPRFYLALALGQEGRAEEAAEALEALLADAPPDAPWIVPVRNALARLGTTAEPVPGPTAADVEAASEMAPEDRAAMIEGMVAQLAERLEEEPDDAEGWARLVRSYMVLGRPDEASSALDKARAALDGDTRKLAIVESEAAAAGVDE